MSTDRQTTPNPGSAEAVALGCKCAVLDNARGRGDGRGNFWITESCPVHAPKKETVTNADTN